MAFRAFVVRAASGLELDGWVRNRIDGSVEVLAGGRREDLDELELRLEQGSRWSRVDDLAVEEVDESLEAGAGFSIRPTS